jgi:nitrite reductase/ring-hydroxylating ferredoxin subunit
MIQGEVGGEDVVLARRGSEFFAVGAYSTHYHGSFAEGLMMGDKLRCPLHLASVFGLEGRFARQIWAQFRAGAWSG